MALTPINPVVKPKKNILGQVLGGIVAPIAGLISPAAGAAIGATATGTQLAGGGGGKLRTEVPMVKVARRDQGVQQLRLQEGLEALGKSRFFADEDQRRIGSLLSGALRRFG